MKRCKSYFYGRGVFPYLHGRRCELPAGHSGQHRNIVDARFLDPRAGGPGVCAVCEAVRGDSEHPYSYR